MKIIKKIVERIIKILDPIGWKYDKELKKEQGKNKLNLI